MGLTHLNLADPERRAQIELDQLPKWLVRLNRVHIESRTALVLCMSWTGEFSENSSMLGLKQEL